MLYSLLDQEFVKGSELNGGPLSVEMVFGVLYCENS